jgi:phage shock protein C
MQGKRIVRPHERMFAGVANGLAAYFNIDPVLVRLGFVVLALINGIGIAVYLILWLLLPSADSSAPDTRGQVQENLNEMQGAAERFLARVRDVVKQFAEELRGTSHNNHK